MIEIAENLDVTLVQTYLHWEDKSLNLKRMENHINSIKNLTDIIILPEMFSTAFTMNNSLYEEMDGETIRWMQKMAKQTNAAVCGSIIIKEENNFYNRFIFAEPNNKISFYDKHHTFRMANEQKHYSSGENKNIIEYRGWKILPLICYDLRFPVWSRNKSSNNELEYDLIIYVANWPEKRNPAWKALLPARAVENQSFVAAVNRIGMDGNGTNYTGDSGIWGVLGDNLLPFSPEEEQVKSWVISLPWLKEFRKNFPVWMDADEFELK
jgi:predicted amidohydrolase